MILSDQDLQARLDRGDIVIDPLDDPGLQIQPASIDLRLDSHFIVYTLPHMPCLDPRDPATIETYTRPIDIPEGDAFILHPGEFALGSTYERVKVPADLVARVEGRSSIGRLAVVVHATAGFIDPGFEGQITLELANLGGCAVKLYPGMRISQIVFHTMTSPAERPYGPARGASTRANPDRLQAASDGTNRSTVDFFHWNFDPVLVRIPLGFDAPLLGDNIQIRWYGLFFAIGLLLAVQRLGKSFVDRGLSEEHAASLSWIIPVSMILFAHLIHLVFYEPRSFIDNPRRIIEIGKGLASHGGAVGVIVAVYWFARAHGRTFHEYMDAVMVASVWCFPWVRIGNFFNSEIVGRTTDVPWAVVFEQVDPANARHPQQIYEALAGFALIGITELLDRKYRDRLRRGSLFYVSLGLYFSYRFALEFFKEKQGVDVEWSLNMGHLLSIGPIVVCAAMLFGTKSYRLFPLLGEGEKPAPAPLEDAAAPANPDGTQSSTKPHTGKRKKKKR